MLCERSADVLQALRGSVVVVPAVTSANVGELAIDVLVATLQRESLGALESVNVLPVVGNDAYALDGSSSSPHPGLLCTALELFRIAGRPLVLLQQRAPAMLGRQSAYADELVGWLREAGVAAVLMLTGLDAQLRRDQQLDSSPFRFLASSDSLRSACTSQQSPQQTSEPSQLTLMELESEIREEELQLHHSLPPWPLVAECTKQGLPYIMLGCFAAEGDNAGEGLQLAARALQVLSNMAAGESDTAVLSGCAGVELRPPASWVGLYGRSFPTEIF